MISLRRRLPSPNGLVGFEAVARHLSFTRAAGELGVSQAAASRQVKLLEEDLGLALFDRDGRRVKLTPAGEQLLAAVTMGLGHIAATSDALRKRSHGPQLSIATTIAFASFWLMPRLGRFHALHPRHELRLVSSDNAADWQAEGTDLVVAYGIGRWPGYEGVRLFDDSVLAVCHPDYLGGRPAPRRAADLLGETLLHMEARAASWLSWHDWLQGCGVRPPRRLAGPTFSSYTITIQAALDGRGVALGWRRLIAPRLAEGTLVQVTDGVLRPRDGYHLLTAQRLAGDARARALREWILAEAAAEEAVAVD